MGRSAWSLASGARWDDHLEFFASNTGPAAAAPPPPPRCRLFVQLRIASGALLALQLAGRVERGPRRIVVINLEPSAVAGRRLRHVVAQPPPQRPGRADERSRGPARPLRRVGAGARPRGHRGQLRAPGSLRGLPGGGARDRPDGGAQGNFNHIVNNHVGFSTKNSRNNLGFLTKSLLAMISWINSLVNRL